MGFNKQSGKGRLDKWYRLAKEKGYRARAAFKLIQLNKKYHVLEKSKVLIDLCAAPGSWCQVAAEVMPVNSIIVGVDLAPIKPIPRCILFQSDITTDKCRATIRQHLKTWKADTVLHDGAPNVGTAWVQDAFSQAELVLQSLKLATEFLTPGGTFITKIFRSKDYNSLLWVFNQLFAKVEATKPPSSRNVSAEIFVVCREYKAPKKIDPRFLDPKTVFAELQDPTPNNEAKVFNPAVKKRKRDGYEEGDWTQHKEAPASEFIQTGDPIAMLGSLNKLSFEQTGNGDVALAALDRLPETTQEIRDCCADLKVLGRKDFKLLLKWRLKIREKFGFRTKQTAATTPTDADGEEVAEVESMDEELQIQEELQRLKEQTDKLKKKDRRKDNERKQKELVRLQMNMTTPFDIGVEQHGPNGPDSMFALKTLEKDGAKPTDLTKGKMHTVTTKPEPEPALEDELDSDSDGENLEAQLDSMYEQYRERKSMADAKYRAKQARTETSDDFEGFSDREESSGAEDEVIEEDQDSDSSSDEDTEPQPLLKQFGSSGKNTQGLSNRAATFFDQAIFKDIPGLDDPLDDDSGIEMQASDDAASEANEEIESQLNTLNFAKRPSPSSPEPPNPKKRKTTSNVTSSSDFEIVPTPAEHADQAADSDSDTSATGSKRKTSRPNIDIITAEAMTLAHSLATGARTRTSAIDDSFNKYTLRDVDGLPEWFLDDESSHSRPQRPVSAAAAAAIKEKLRALNARPIKKVREAKARKKFKAAQKLEKLKRKSDLLVDDADSGLSERDKAKQVEQLMRKAAKKKPKQQVKLVVARGANKGLKGRPRGAKGKYKMVDARMKKERRAEKRIAKRGKSKK